MDKQIQSEIKLLLNVARPGLIKADRGGGYKLFNEISEEFGPVAHRVYLALDKPERSIERYHDKETKRVMLDPWTVFNRTKNFSNFGITIDDVEFWCHCDMIKTLCDYIDLRFKEIAVA